MAFYIQLLEEFKWTLVAYASFGYNARIWGQKSTGNVKKNVYFEWWGGRSMVASVPRSECCSGHPFFICLALFFLFFSFVSRKFRIILASFSQCGLVIHCLRFVFVIHSHVAFVIPTRR